MNATLPLHITAGREAGAENVPGKKMLTVAYGMFNDIREDTICIAAPNLGYPFSEIWSAPGDTIGQSGYTDGFFYTPFGDDMLLGHTMRVETLGMHGLTKQVYEDVIKITAEHGCPHLVRVWNHFQNPHYAAYKTSRYEDFCGGRREAVDKDATLPAVTTTGTTTHGLMIYFLAAKTPAIELQNPRQTPPSEYPEGLGPHGYSFCRGVRCETAGHVFASGTAPILGHETQHLDNPESQIELALENLDIVLNEGGGGGIDATQYIKVYLADPRHLGPVRARARNCIPEHVELRFLHSELCRKNLCVEVEAHCPIKA